MKFPVLNPSDRVAQLVERRSIVIRRSRVQDPAAADNIFLLALGMEII